MSCSQQTQSEQDTTANVLADCIPDAVVEAAARGWYEAEMATRFAWVSPLIAQTRARHREWARAALTAALAGAGWTVVALPEADDVVDGRAYWRSNSADFEIGTRVDYAGVPTVDDGPRVMSAEYAEVHGLALVAAARAARRLAAVCPRDGDTR